jgi:hypothetical protein
MKPKSSTRRETASFLLGISVFLPYPAFPIGNQTGLQVGHLAALAYIAINFKSILAKGQRTLFPYSLLAIPILLSAILRLDETVNLFTSISMLVALLWVIVGSDLSREQFKGILKGAFFAITLHAIVGLIQQYYYLNSDFPFLFLYQNPSFSPLNDEFTWKIYALYTQRSFGLLPEPSSMFAALGCWILIAGALVLNPNAYWRDYLLSGKSLLVAFVLGLSLVYFARSGGTVFLILCLFVLYLKRFVDNIRSLATIDLIIALLILLSIAYYIPTLSDSLSERAQVEVSQAGSWDDRLTSILFGINYLYEADLMGILFGSGLGMVSPLTYAATGASSVHSWVVAFVMGTGLVGILFLGGAVYYVARSISLSQYKLLGILLFFLWMVIATVVTGYIQLLSMWLMFGVLVSWDRLGRDIGPSNRG